MKGYQILTALTLLLLSAIGAKAQTAEYQYEVTYKDTEGKVIPGKGRLGHYFDYSEAQRVYRELNKRKKELYMQVAESANEFALGGNPEGKFEFVGTNGMGVVFCMIDLEDDFVLIHHADGNFTNKPGKTAGDLSYRLSCKRIGDNKYLYTLQIDLPRQIQNVDVTKKLKGGGNRRRAFNFNDGMEHFELHLEIPDDGKHTEDSRIIILPYAIDCMTDDTVAYLPPAVYEGSKYYELQNRRKGFDYAKNDPLGRDIIYKKHFVSYDTVRRAPIIKTTYLRDKNNRLIEDGKGGYKSKVDTVNNDTLIVKEWDEVTRTSGFICKIDQLQRDSSLNVIVIDTVIDWKKPIKDKTYRCVVKYSMEDYHHTYFQAEDPGTCLRINPFKFLQMGTAAVDLPLTQEFYENAEEKPTDAEQGLRMQFQYNSANIIEDSLTNVDIQELHTIIRDINVNGGKILGATLEAYASPDGREDVNRRLAGERAQAARSRLGLGGMKVDTKAVIDTWENTAKLLDEDMHPREAQAIRNALANSKNDYEAYQEIRKMETYADVVKPTLEKQCRINFKFKFFTKRKLNPREAVQAYYKKKNDLFSNGDYYNMFAEIKDSVELDTLTTIVYNRLIKQQKAYDRPLAPYVVNRMAMMGIRKNLPDSTILAALIEDNGATFQLNWKKTDPDGIRDPIIMNRPEIVLNQAVTYYILQEPDRASFYVDMLKENGYNSPALERLNAYINFTRLYQIPENQRSAPQQAAFESALAFVEKSGPDNKAVLYTEFEALGKRSVARQEILKMKDENPVKWYLMGILWANTPHYGTEADNPLNEAAFATPKKLKRVNPLLTEDEEFDLMEKNYAQYEAYLKEKEAYLKEHPDAKPQPPIEEEQSAVASDGVDMNANVKGIPYYLGYFQHSFDQDQKYMRYYFTDGQIDEEKRKKKMHAYKMDRIPAYKKIFKLRKVEDDQERANLLKQQQQPETAKKQDSNDQAINDTNK